MTCFITAIFFSVLLLQKVFFVVSFGLTQGTKIKCMSTKKDCDILLRTLRGEDVERTPVWLMRQAGRYMAEFRAFSEKYDFRERSETPDIAIELSLQPWRAFSTDGVIMFSDILTPFPSMGLDFSIVPGKGPKILKPIRSINDVENLNVILDVDRQVPFLGPILKSLRKETEGKTTLIGFIGAPWTLAGYAVEGGHSKLCASFKRMCLTDPILAHVLLDKIADSLCTYASFQIECGAQVLQIFESWAHHLSEEQFIAFAKPYANKIARYLKAKHPDVPVVYFANGGSCFLKQQLDMAVDAISVDWRISMRTARRIAGPHIVLAGNVDPTVLYGSEEMIKTAVSDCIAQAGKVRHVLNLGHGIEKDTPESAVRSFIEAAKSTN